MSFITRQFLNVPLALSLLSSVCLENIFILRSHLKKLCRKKVCFVCPGGSIWNNINYDVGINIWYFPVDKKARNPFIVWAQDGISLLKIGLVLGKQPV